MATKNHNLSKFDSPLPSAADMRFGIVVAEWNREVTEALLEGAVRTLRAAGCPDMNIQVKYVPGTFELSLGAQFFAEYTDVDAVIDRKSTRLNSSHSSVSRMPLRRPSRQQGRRGCGHGHQHGEVADRHGGGFARP